MSVAGFDYSHDSVTYGHGHISGIGAPVDAALEGSLHSVGNVTGIARVAALLMSSQLLDSFFMETISVIQVRGPRQRRQRPQQHSLPG